MRIGFRGWDECVGSPRTHPGARGDIASKASRRSPRTASFDGSDHLLGGVLQVGGDDEVQAAGREDLLAFLDVGALKAHNHRHLDADLLGRVHDAGSHDVAAHDAAEDVHQHGLHRLVLQDDAEGVLHRVFGGAAAYVQEVGRGAAAVLDDVHGGHGQAGAVHHAADAAIELDEVEVVLAGFHFLFRFLVEVAVGQDIRVADQAVVIEADLGVQGRDIPLLGHHQRVDLHHGAVLLHKELVEVLEEDDALLEGIAFEPQGEGHLARLEAIETQGRIHGHPDDLLGGLFGDFLDLHTTLGGRQDGDPAGHAVHQEAQVELTLDVHGLGEEHRANLAPLGTGLFGDQLHADHGLEELGSLVGIRRELHATALAAATSVDLRLDDTGAAEFLGNHAGFYRILGDLPVGRGHLVLPQQLFGLVFMDIHTRSRTGHPSVSRPDCQVRTLKAVTRGIL